MPVEGKESLTVNLYGGTGGVGGAGGITGGAAGKGEGATMKIDSVQTMTNHIGGSLVVQIDKLKEDLGKWLGSPPDTKDRQHELKSLHHQATGGWLLRDGRFVRWKATPGALWIKGISGTGKSVLSSTVIEEIVKACPESAVTYFYFDFRNEWQHMDLMLRSIIWQLSGHLPSPYSSLDQLYETLGNGTIQPQQGHLQALLEDLLSELDQTYIVIDGLDECNKTDWKHLIKFICSLCNPAKNALHLLFTSQPLKEFQTAFKDVTFIELGSWVSNDDIRSFVGSEVPGACNWAGDDNNSVKKVTEPIVKKSNGMFRLAACLLIELHHCDWEDDWDEILTALPADLFAIYNRFLTRAADTPRRTLFIQAIFRWLVFSARQLTSDELADAIAFCLDDPTFDFSDPAKSIYYPNRRQGNSGIFKLLEGLIVIKKDYSWSKPSIAFAHSSVKDYILSMQFHQAFGRIINLTKGISHRFLTQTCVRYLLFADAKHLMTKDTLSDYPLLLYAAEYWFHHLQLCNDRDHEALLPSTMHLPDDRSGQCAALYQSHYFNPYWTQVWDRPMLRPVCICAEMGYTEGVHFLLIKCSTSVDQATQDGKTALHLASEKGHLDIARLLIEHHASINIANIHGLTALHLASEKGHLDITRLLIEHNASVDLATKDGTTVLHLASEKGHLDIARLLIEHHASVDIADIDGLTALHFASTMGQVDIVRLLIERNASVDPATRFGETPLHLASEKGHLDIARLLIEHHASVDITTIYGLTAFYFA